ncbi:MAG: segregation/condensation protein A [Fretibacterium sp.]|nr:segregation/condensation protein A [Fretibacterium sp.]
MTVVKEALDVSIEGFSGPLDLLCHLVESRQIQASRIKVAHLVRVYGVYLAKTHKASVETIAEFFFMMAGLLLQKTRSLLPEPPPEESEAEEDESFLNEDDFLEILARYRPYRNAAVWLLERKTETERSFRRVPEADLEVSGDSEYDIGDIYFLARLWWALFEKYALLKHGRLTDFSEEETWDGLPEALPEGSLIERRIEELEEQLKTRSVLSLRALWVLAPSVKNLVVTLLAILEMCRMGRTMIEQEVPFSDVTIRLKP